MTTHCAQEINLPALHVKQAILHQCLFLLPLFCVVLSLKIFEHSLENSMDMTLVQYFKTLRQTSPVLTDIMRAISKYTSFLLLGCYLWALSFCYRRQQVTKFRFLLASIIIYYTFLSVTLYVLKIGIGMPRPYADSTSNNPLSLNPDYHSFPSGHTAECAALTSSLAHFLKTYASTFLLGCLMATVGFSRVFCSMHHVMDLLPGALLGGLAPILASQIVTRKFWRNLPFATLFTGGRVAD